MQKSAAMTALLNDSGLSARENYSAAAGVLLFGLGLLAVDALGDTGRLAATVAQVIELGAAHERRGARP